MVKHVLIQAKQFILQNYNFHLEQRALLLCRNVECWMLLTNEIRHSLYISHFNNHKIQNAIKRSNMNMHSAKSIERTMCQYWNMNVICNKYKWSSGMCTCVRGPPTVCTVGFLCWGTLLFSFMEHGIWDKKVFAMTSYCWYSLGNWQQYGQMKIMNWYVT